MAGAFAVTFDEDVVRVGSRNGVKGAVVYANNSDDAKAILKALYGDDVDAGWDNATYTAMAAGADLSGWSLRCAVFPVAAGAAIVDVTVVGDDTNNTVDEIAAAMVTALAALDDTANAAYNASTQTLTVAGTADALGDKRLVVEFWPPVGSAGEKVTVPGFVGAVTDQGSAADALTVVLAADAYTVPAVTKEYAEAIQ